MADFELRINSLDDAHAAVHYKEMIVTQMVKANAEKLFVLIADQINPGKAFMVLNNEFPCKTKFLTVLNKAERILFQLPHWVQPSIDVPKACSCAPAPEPRLKRHYRKRKVVVPDASPSNSG
jgi:hypothetical protein